VTTPAAMTNPAPRSEKAVDRNGDRVFRKDFVVKRLRPPKAALRALDNKILSKLLPAIAIDGALRSMMFDRIAKQTV
jgi:hypothetical protein